MMLGMIKKTNNERARPSHKITGGKTGHQQPQPKIYSTSLRKLRASAVAVEQSRYAAA